MAYPRRGEAVSCPEPGLLLAFREGSLSAAAAEEIGSHLAECPRCGSAFRDLQGKHVTSHRLENPGTDAASGADILLADKWSCTTRPGASPGPEGEEVRLRGEVATPEPPIPSRLGQYQVGARIGRGGMGAVYRALHTRLKKWVALKILPPDRVRDPQLVARFEREMEVIGRLDHHHIVRALDAGEAEGVHFLVMELIEGTDLGQLVRRHGPLGVADACEVIRQAALGLQYAHERGLVHRDIKPSNLMLSSVGVVKILDLGLARLQNGPTGTGPITSSGMVMGTFDYMAPEQWEASHEVDIRADLYSLGCTLYTLLRGQPPFAGSEFDSSLKKMKAHAEKTAPPLRTVRADVPERLSAILQRLLQKLPAERFDLPAALVEALQPFCAGADLAQLLRDAPSPHISDPQRSTEGLVGNHTAGARHTIPRARATRRRLGWTAAFLGVLGLGIAGAFWIHSQPPHPLPDEPRQGLSLSAVEPEAGQTRRFVPWKWHNLLEGPPHEFFWKPRRSARWDYDKERQTLWIHTSDIALLSLGKTEHPSYKLQVNVAQVQWEGGIGVFFGGRSESGLPQTRLSYQAIHLATYLRQGANRLALDRGRGSIDSPERNKPSRQHALVGSALLHRPLDQGEQRLEIVVKEGEGLSSVRWNGEEFAELCNPSSNALFKEADYRGEFGVFCRGAPSTVSSAQFMPLE